MAALGCVQVLLMWIGIIALTLYPLTTEAQIPHPQCNFQPSSIVQPEPTGLPAQIEPEFPANCEHVSVEYTCSEPGHVPRTLSDVEPYTVYNCTGLIKDNNVSINKTLPPVHIYIDCNLYIDDNHDETNTSIELYWKTTSQNCGGLQKLTQLSYSCSCESDGRSKGIHMYTNKPDEGSCEFIELEPFTDYNCEVQHFYKNKKVSGQKTVTVKTKPGVPDRVNVYLDAPENNVMNVECEPSQNGFGELYNFKGPERIFIAHLVGHKEVNSSNCSFTFEDLSYVTTYKVEVIAFNGVLKSEPSIKEFKTSYHISFYIRLIIVPFSAVMPGVATFILNRKLKQIINDEKEESDPVYAEAQPPE